jgi:hypothetical protein
LRAARPRAPVRRTSRIRGDGSIVDGEVVVDGPAWAEPRGARPLRPGVIEGRIVEGETGAGPVIEGEVIEGEVVEGPDTGGGRRAS